MAAGSTKKAQNPPKKKAKSAGKAKRPGRKGGGAIDSDAIAAFREPMRTRMVYSLNEEGDGSASEVAERLGLPPQRLYYHFNKLVDYGFVEIVRTERRGNVLKAIYRAIRRAELTFEEWEQLPPAAQESWMRLGFKDMFDDARQGFQIGSFQRWPRSPILGDRLWVDRKAFDEISELAEDFWDEAIAIATKSFSRLAKVEAEGGEVLKLSLHTSIFPIETRGSQTS